MRTPVRPRLQAQGLQLGADLRAHCRPCQRTCAPVPRATSRRTCLLHGPRLRQQLRAGKRLGQQKQEPQRAARAQWTACLARQ